MGFAEGFQVGFNAARTARENDLRDKLTEVNKDFTPTQTAVASGVEALTGAQQAKQMALANATDDASRAQIEQEYAPTMQALEADTSRPAGVVHSLGVGNGFQQRDKDFSADEVSGAKAVAKSGVYSDSGQEDNAQRVLTNEQKRREMNDQTELRTVMARPQDARLATVQGGVAEPVNQGLDRQASTAYYERKAPEIIDTYLKQGKLDEAKKYRDFVSSTAGQDYTEKWSKGVRMYAIGDHQGALQEWQNLYNTQLYNDGKTVKLTPSQDGKQVGVEWIGQDGKSLGATTQPIDVFAKQAGMALAPEALVKFRAEQEAKRESEAATLDRQIQLEKLKQEGQDTRDDRRDDRLARRLEGAGGLTLPQQRTNESILAARRQLAGMTQPDVLAKTQPSTATGRANPNYDQQLAQLVRTANTRMYGVDPAHDKFTAGPRQPAQPAGSFDRNEVAQRFRSDKSMNPYVLGNHTPKGVEVKDKTGKLVGYYR